MERLYSEAIIIGSGHLTFSQSVKVMSQHVSVEFALYVGKLFSMSAEWTGLKS